MNSISTNSNFRISDLKYLMAYSIPLTALVGIYLKGIWVFATPFYVFVILPLLELISTRLGYDTMEDDESKNLVHWIFDLMLYLNLPIIIGILYYSLNTVLYTNCTTAEFIGLFLTTGIVLSSNGINVAHELCHRENTFEKSLGKLMLLPSFFMHFYIEHNFGHHLHVATKEDPVTARYNQPLYTFWIIAPIREVISAINIQRDILRRTNSSFFSIKNDLLWYFLFQLSYALFIIQFFGVGGLFFCLLCATVSILLFESVNYIEHYGLMRQKTNSGRYERVQSIHSWNSDHALGRIVLYELTRHSDHHYKSTKKYQNLISFDQAPQLPYGYPTSILLAMVPWLWFKLINPRVPKSMIV